MVEPNVTHDNHDEEKSSRRYLTGDMTKTLGVSRASLRYYEQAGLVNPTKDPETGVREYSNDDVFNLFTFKALSNLGLTAREITSAANNEAGLFNEIQLEEYLGTVKNRISYYEALRDAIDRMRMVRLRDRQGPEVLVEYVERHIFAEDGAENGYLEFRESEELDSLAACLPISGFGILFGLDEQGNTTWHWGRTIPTRFATVAGIYYHFPLQVGGCECITMIGRTVDDRVPLPANYFDPLYRYAEELGRVPAGDPFVPYIFPPHPGTPYRVCLPLEDAGTSSAEK